MRSSRRGSPALAYATSSTRLPGSSMTGRAQGQRSSAALRAGRSLSTPTRNCSLTEQGWMRSKLTTRLPTASAGTSHRLRRSTGRYPRHTRPSEPRSTCCRPPTARRSITRLLPAASTTSAPRTSSTRRSTTAPTSRTTTRPSLTSDTRRSWPCCKESAPSAPRRSSSTSVSTQACRTTRPPRRSATTSSTRTTTTSSGG